MCIYIRPTSSCQSQSIKMMEENFAKPTEITIDDHEALKTSLMDLAEIREEIKRARESAVQSWLDALPIIEELEKLKSDLLGTKRRVSMAATAISSLESLLESTMETTRSKQDEENNANKAMGEIQAARDRETKEKEKLLVDIDEEKRAREKLKGELKIKKQSLKALQLTRRAVSTEIKAFNISGDASIHHMKQVEMDHRMVALSHEEYNQLQRDADEEMTLANWHVAASEKQRRAAEASRDYALRRLEVLYSRSQGREMGKRESTLVEVEKVEGKEVTRMVSMAIDEEIVSANASPVHQSHVNFGTRKSTDDRRNSKPMRRSGPVGKGRVVKKKPSAFQKLLSPFCGI